MEVVLGDVGAAGLASMELRCRLLDKHRKNQGLGICTVEYRSPDVVLGNADYGQKTDMWSLGCVAFEVVAGKRPFDRLQKPERPSNTGVRDAAKAAAIILEQKKCRGIPR